MGFELQNQVTKASIEIFLDDSSEVEIECSVIDVDEY